MSFLAWIVAGLIAGWLAGQVMKGGGYGVLVDIILGILGGQLRNLNPAKQRRSDFRTIAEHGRRRRRDLEGVVAKRKTQRLQKRGPRLA